MCELSKIDLKGVTTKEDILEVMFGFPTLVDEIEVSTSSVSALQIQEERKMKLNNVQPFDKTTTTITGWIDAFERACVN